MDLNPDLIKQYLLAGVRWALAMFAGKLIAWVAAVTGLDVSQTTQAFAALIVTGLMVLWSLANKTRYEAKVNTALETPKGTSKDVLKEIIALGEGVAATVKK
jgi:hypothetical protein